MKREGFVFDAHHAGRAEYSGVQAAGFSQHQHALMTQTNKQTNNQTSLFGVSDNIQGLT